jgi:hypothetical protein
MEDHQLSPEDEQRLENELKALNLELNHGLTHFFAADDAPPELVGQFLDNVAKFHEAQARGELVPIRQFAKIGKLPAADALDESELEPHIGALLRQLEAGDVAIDRPEHLSARGYYRFLTEEFLEHQITNHPVKGGEPERYKGLGISQVAWEEGEWRVQGLMMPGFEF